MAGPLLFLLVFFALIVLHELIHGITWSLFTENRMKDIEFGVMWKYLTPYCTCRKSLKRGQYITGTLMPTIVLGFIPAIASIISGRQSRDTLFHDHPYEAGLVVFDKAEETN